MVMVVMCGGDGMIMTVVMSDGCWIVAVMLQQPRVWAVMVPCSV